ncbi:DUF6168 family protein [Wenyingzhuangia sp. IMCC45574]
MMKSHVKGLSIFVLVNLFVFLGHTFFTDASELTVNIPLSYGINTAASLLICIVVFYLQDMFKSQIGFVFLALSFLKMIVLYLILKPEGTDEGVATLDAMVIFVPFFVNLILEQVFMIKVLKVGEVLGALRKD